MLKIRSSVICIVALLGSSLVLPLGAAELPEATMLKLNEYDGLKAMVDAERLVAYYGVPMATEENELVSTDDFVEGFVFDDTSLFGYEGLEIHDGYDKALSIRGGKFSVYTYHQEITSEENADTQPVHGTSLKILVLHLGNGDRKITYVGTNLVKPPTVDFEEDTVTNGPAAITIVSEHEAYDHLDTFVGATQVIFQDGEGVLHRTWRFYGVDEDEEYLFFVDSVTGEILSAESSMLGANVTGDVTGATTADPLSAEVDLAMPWVKVGVYEPVGGGCGVGDLIDEGYADEDGHFLFTGISPPARLVATLDSDVVTVLRAQFPYFYPVEACKDVEFKTDSDIYFDATPSSADLLGTAAMNAYSVIHQSHDFWELIQPTSDAADVHVECTVNNEGCGASAYILFSYPGIGFYRDSGSCRNSAYTTIASHEYMHVIQGQLFGNGTNDIRSFAEGTADTFAAFYWNTPIIGEGYYPNDDPIRNIDTPEIVNPGSVCKAESGISYVYVCGTALGGAFWDMRENMIEDEVPQDVKVAAELFADFMEVTDGQWDDSFLAELLAVDDNDGTFANGTPHSDQIIPAFVAHGFFSPLCTEETCGDVVVEWVGPPDPPSQEDGDFLVIDGVVPPMVILYRTEKDEEPVVSWTIGRESGGDLAAVIAEWDNEDPKIYDVDVRIGSDLEAQVRHLNTVDVTPQTASKYINVRLDLTGDVRVRANAYVSNDDRGGRISGDIAGDVRFIGAKAIGEGASSAGELVVGGVITNADFGFIQNGSELAADNLSTLTRLTDDLGGYVHITDDLVGYLTIVGSGTSSSLIEIDGDLLGAITIEGDMAGDVHITGNLDGVLAILGTFTGDVCAANIIPGEEFPDGLEIATWGSGATICGASYCTTSSQCLYTEDLEWCTVDMCENNACIAVCVTHKYGDVAPAPQGNNIVNLDDMMAVNSAYSGIFTNCLGGTKAGCDVWGASSCSPQNQEINLDDILKVNAAFSGRYACTSPCNCGDSFAGGGEGYSGADGSVDAASQIIELLRTVAVSEEMPEEVFWTVAYTTAVWCLEDMSEAEIDEVLAIAQEALPLSVTELNEEWLNDFIGRLK